MGHTFSSLGINNRCCKIVRREDSAFAPLAFWSTLSNTDRGSDRCTPSMNSISAYSCASLAAMRSYTSNCVSKSASLGSFSFSRIRAITLFNSKFFSLLRIFIRAPMSGCLTTIAFNNDIMAVLSVTSAFPAIVSVGLQEA